MGCAWEGEALGVGKRGVPGSFRHYLTGVAVTVEIESEWTARKRERMGIFPQVKSRREQ